MVFCQIWSHCLLATTLSVFVIVPTMFLIGLLRVEGLLRVDVVSRSVVHRSWRVQHLSRQILFLFITFWFLQKNFVQHFVFWLKKSQFSIPVWSVTSDNSKLTSDNFSRNCCFLFCVFFISQVFNVITTDVVEFVLNVKFVGMTTKLLAKSDVYIVH